MKLFQSVKKLSALATVGLAVLLAFPVMLSAQGRGRGRGRGPDLSKKCGKFVNCHDARDGRWDGRGPNRARGSRIGDIFRGRRTRRIHNDDNFIIGRNRRIDRDGDGDFDRNDRLIGRQQNRLDRIERRAARRQGRWNR